jgi:hypothetical protein
VSAAHPIAGYCIAVIIYVEGRFIITSVDAATTHIFITTEFGVNAEFHKKIFQAVDA